MVMLAVGPTSACKKPRFLRCRSQWPDEPCRGEDLRQAAVLGIRVLRPRREQPVAFSSARLRAPPRLILERARIAQCLGHVLLVPGPDVPRRGGADSIRAPAQHCLDAIEDLRRGLGAVDPEHRERSLQIASIPASPGSLGLSSTFAIQVLSA